MKNVIMVLAIMSLTIVGCGNSKSDDHEHNDDGSHPDTESVHEHDDGTEHMHDGSEHEQEEFKVENDSHVIIEEAEGHTHGDDTHKH